MGKFLAPAATEPLSVLATFSFLGAQLPICAASRRADFGVLVLPKLWYLPRKPSVRWPL
jgi:hypothetical protein